ncbi:MAG: hypothetical protein LPK12_10825 [Rhodobacterales bacterium]|nr:hypothetical protein [Rhodobacterales bacterium]MDX5500443.1 hypothetical protein [Rhodobacterales bacterium]
MAWVGLAVQAIVFAVWAWLAFRALFQLRARAVDRSGRAFPGLAATQEAFGAFLRAPEFAHERRQLGLASAALIVMMLINRMLWVPR